VTGPDRLALLAKRSRRTVEDVTELWHERAAIREYDGGKRRKEAEQLALDDVANIVLAPSSLEGGVGCGTLSLVR
jgi:hypothetical protein